MEEFKNELKDKIRKERPKLRDSSLNAYVFNIVKLYKLMDLEDEPDNLDFLQDYDGVMDAIQDKKLSTKKTFLAAIVVALMADQEDDEDKELIHRYRTEMEKLADQNNKEQKEQKLSDTQSENWVSLDALKKVMRKYKTDIMDRKLLNKDKLDKKEMDLLQKWLVSSLYLISDKNPPLRLEYGNMAIITEPEYKKLSEEDKKKNYLVVKNKSKKYFHLGEYKTSGTYGQKQIPIGKTLNSVLNIWMKYNKTKHLLLNTSGNMMGSNGLTKYLNRVFEPTGKKNISASMLRHIYITTKFPPQLSDREKTADLMNHSVGQQVLYSKKTDDEKDKKD